MTWAGFDELGFEVELHLGDWGVVIAVLRVGSCLEFECEKFVVSGANLGNF